MIRNLQGGGVALEQSLDCWREHYGAPGAAGVRSCAEEEILRVEDHEQRDPREARP